MGGAFGSPEVGSVKCYNIAEVDKVTGPLRGQTTYCLFFHFLRYLTLNQNVVIIIINNRGTQRRFSPKCFKTLF